MNPALEVEHLSVAFGRTAVLRDLSFRVARGSTLAVIGPDGAGKTVLFRALIGAVPHQGTVRWAPGTRFGYVPQKLDIERDLPLRDGRGGLPLERGPLRVQPGRRNSLALGPHGPETGSDHARSRMSFTPAVCAQCAQQ